MVANHGFSDLDPDTGMTIGVEFQISMYAVSGLRVDSLRLFHEGYKPYKVRKDHHHARGYRITHRVFDRV